MSGANFRQHRKAEAAHTEPVIRRVLASWYDVDESQVVCVESEADGRHDPDTLDSDMVLDYAGVDWLVDDSPRVIPVAQRVRPTGDEIDFSIRIRNEAAPACERDYMAQSPLAPSLIVFARADGAAVSGCWLIDPVAVVSTLENHRDAVETHDSGDGTTAAYLSVDQLRRRGCIVHEPDPETWKPHPETHTDSRDTSHMSDGGNHNLSDDEIRQIKADPVLTVDDVLEDD
ncbi:hypothetical protein OSG_eHP18_00140 [environmental Halophage eHP-18]|nr:hypothetical protein OSG_eHP17_00050 [environmental Halophage eHP-17]AFH22185.1 hypothetical protein OSG_eHP18_00140 [environmental Halophage eHP-18]AFH22713.1 hypothetical protein OSG_eHP33_00050 [environmental Halophage eHP-33]